MTCTVAGCPNERMKDKSLCSEHWAKWQAYDAKTSGTDLAKALTFLHLADRGEI